MISRVRAIYEKSHAIFSPEGRSLNAPAAVADLFKEGYVELFGEINPQPIEAVHYSITLPKPNSEKETPNTQSLHEAVSFVYEYFWSVGMAGHNTKWYDQLDGDDPIVIQLIFHTQGSKYATQEVAANLKQVPPFKKTTEDKIHDWFVQFQPIVDTAGKVLSLGGAKVPGDMLSAIAQMKLNSMPVDQFPWWVKTISSDNDAGIEWHIPKKLIEYLGNRLVGSLGICFIKCNSCAVQNTLQDKFSIEIRAFVRLRELTEGVRELFLSPTNVKTQLEITPKPEQNP